MPTGWLEALPFAIAVGVSPFPIIGAVLILAGPRPRNGWAFLLGLVAALVAGIAVVLVLESRADARDAGGTARWVLLLKLALGVALVVLAARQWQGRPRRGEEPHLPAWMARLDDLRAPRAALLGALLGALNPKALVLIAGAGTSIAASGATGGALVSAAAVFVVVGSLGTGIPVIATAVGGAGAAPALERARGLLVRYKAPMTATILLVLGAKLLVDAVRGLAG